ncbi:MAG: hypothetical protein RLZZ142_1262 [Verrucomicrobiota bacterium]|jgi:riboflavin kinase/FMN adenylyltransferase
MEIFENLCQLAALRGPVVLAIGVFDGLHRGHQAVLGRAQREAADLGGTALPLTFDPHPARVVRPEQAPALLCTSPCKTRILASMGFEACMVLPFTSALAATPPEDFITSLAGACAPLGAICVGQDWSFGKGRAGNLALLERLGQALRFRAIGVDPLLFEGSPISSTRIRGALAQGELPAAASMLGRPFSICGKVTQGRRLGRTLGFPTANLPLHNELLPPHGVYAVRVQFDNHRYLGVANLGVRPTVEARTHAPSLEVHLFDFEGDLYEKPLQVDFLRFQRGERRFDSLAELQAQIQRDAAEARHWLSAHA